MNMFARFDENPAMTLQDIRKQNVTDGWTHVPTHGRENSIPTTNKDCGGYKNLINEPCQTTRSADQLYKKQGVEKTEGHFSLSFDVLDRTRHLRTSDTLIGYLPIFQMLPKFSLCIRYRWYSFE